MKHFFLVFTIVCMAEGAMAAELIAPRASAELPVSAKIINLATMPLHEAIAFCDERAMACPALREKWDAEKEQYLASATPTTRLAYEAGIYE